MGQWVHSGHAHADEYIGSGVPYVSSSLENEIGTTAVEVNFPRVTRWIIVKCTDANHGLRLGFSSLGVSGPHGKVNPHHLTGTHSNYYQLAAGETSPRLELKCTKLFIRNDSSDNDHKTSFSLVAGITGIPNKNMFTISGSNGVGGVG